MDKGEYVRFEQNVPRSFTKHSERPGSRGGFLAGFYLYDLTFEDCHVDAVLIIVALPTKEQGEIPVWRAALPDADEDKGLPGFAEGFLENGRFPSQSLKRRNAFENLGQAG